MKYSINDIAKVITEDPDIISELDSSIDTSLEEPANTSALPSQSVAISKVGQKKPLTATDVEKQATNIAGKNPDQQIKDQIKTQEETQRKQEKERQDMLEPQMQDLQTSMDTLGTGITQGASAAKQSGEAFNGLDKNMSAIQTILQNLEKELY